MIARHIPEIINDIAAISSLESGETFITYADAIVPMKYPIPRDVKVIPTSDIDLLKWEDRDGKAGPKEAADAP